MAILIVEDEAKTLAYLCKGLGESGFAVDSAADGEQGLWSLSTRRYELVVLDVTLPKLDGWALVERLRRGDDQTPVLFLTARDSIQDRVKGLTLGADDYLVKPFAFSELLARIRSVLRRSLPRQVEALVVADLEIDPARRRASRGRQRLDLTPKQFSLLSLFARREGEVLSRTLLAEEVWDINFDSDTNVVDVAIRRLRSKVDDPFEQKLIHTVRGVGYVMEARRARPARDV
jgi:two-component system, OmpR family, copper resistance phosphate regulon response regulator CusR